MTSFSIFRQLNKFKKNLNKVLNTFENIMENGAFAPNEQMLHFPLYFQIHDISKALLWSKGLSYCNRLNKLKVENSADAD